MLSSSTQGGKTQDLKKQPHKANCRQIKLDKLQKAVAKAYIVLLQIGERFKGHKKLTKKVQGLYI